MYDIWLGRPYMASCLVWLVWCRWSVVCMDSSVSFMKSSVSLMSSPVLKIFLFKLQPARTASQHTTWNCVVKNVSKEDYLLPKHFANLRNRMLGGASASLFDVSVRIPERFIKSLDLFLKPWELVTSSPKLFPNTSELFLKKNLFTKDSRLLLKGPKLLIKDTGIFTKDRTTYKRHRTFHKRHRITDHLHQRNHTRQLAI